MFRVSVTDFQSLKKTEIEVKGLTAITGPNNSGKTALMRAIKAVFQNNSNASFVRKHAQGCSILISFEDGQSIEWKRELHGKKFRTCYSINGGASIYPGREIPDEVTSFGIKSLSLAGQTIWPNFAPQFEGQIFLLDKPASVLAEAISDVEIVSKLNDALRISESERRKCQASLSEKTEAVKRTEAGLAQFSDVSSYKKIFASLQPQIESVQKQKSLLTVFSSLYEKKHRADEQIIRVIGITKCILPDLALCQKIVNLFAWATVTKSSYTRCIQQIEGLKVPKIGVDLGPLKSILDEVIRLRSIRDTYVTASTAVAAITAERISLLEKLKETETSLAAYEGMLCPTCKQIVL